MAALQASSFLLLEQTPVAQRLVNRIMGTPCNLHTLAAELFPGKDSLTSLNALIAVGNFAKKITVGSERIFLACRLHLLYRGLEGLFACTNPNCSEREDISVPTLLGDSTPHLACAVSVDRVSMSSLRIATAELHTCAAMCVPESIMTFFGTCPRVGAEVHYEFSMRSTCLSKLRAITREITTMATYTSRPADSS